MGFPQIPNSPRADIRLKPRASASLREDFNLRLLGMSFKVVHSAPSRQVALRDEITPMAVPRIA